MYSSHAQPPPPPPPPPSMLHKPKSSSPTKASSDNLASVLYPRRVTYALSALKIATGCGLVALGAVALYLKASYAGSAAGLWTGIIVVISGVLGAFSVRRNSSRRAYVILFFAACVIAIVADVVVIIYAATGLARDSGFPGGFVRDQLSGDLIPVSQVNIPAREMAMLANLLLIVLGILEVLFTLPSFIICLREICYCYSDSEVLMAAAAVAGSAEQIYEPRNDWLFSWLSQQQQQQQQHPHLHPHHQHQHHQAHPVYFSNASGYPTHVMQAPPFMMFPGGGSPGTHGTHGTSPGQSNSGGSHSRQPSPRESAASRSHSERRSKSQERTRSPVRRHHTAHAQHHSLYGSVPAGHSPHSHFTPLEIYSPHLFLASYPSPGSNGSHPASVPMVPVHGVPPHPHHHQQWIYGDPEMDYYQQVHHHLHRQYYPAAASHHPHHHVYDRAHRRRKTERSSAGRSTSERRKKHGGVARAKRDPTDSDIEKTYAGLDRELAEEFIEQTMDPSALLERNKSAASSSSPPRRGGKAASAGAAGGSTASPTSPQAYNYNVRTGSSPVVVIDAATATGLPMSGAESEGAW